MWTAGSSLCSTQTSLRGTLCWWLWRLVDEKRKVQLHLWLSLKFIKSLVLVFTTQGTERLIVLWVLASVFRDSTNEQVFLARRPLTDFYRMENVSPAERVCVCNNMEAQPCFNQMYSESVQQLLKRPTSVSFLDILHSVSWWSHSLASWVCLLFGIVLFLLHYITNIQHVFVGFFNVFYMFCANKLKCFFILHAEARRLFVVNWWRQNCCTQRLFLILLLLVSWVDVPDYKSLFIISTRGQQSSTASCQTNCVLGDLFISRVL